jgi:hypothetical protein
MLNSRVTVKLVDSDSSLEIQIPRGRIDARWVMSPGGQSNLLLIRRLLHPSTPDFDPIRGRFFAQVLPKLSSTDRITMDVYALAVTPAEEEDTKARW